MRRKYIMKQQLRNKAGFTLVELIVVIAILGILAGVGTVGYSGYVKQANKAKDIQLAGDVKYALQLAALDSSRDFGNGATVVLSPTDAPVCSSIGGRGDAIEAAMAAAFGPDWRGLRLSYEGWDSSNAGSVFAEYSGSSFESKEPELLEDIQTLTDAVDTMLNSVASEGGATALIDLMGGGAFQTYLENKGIDPSDTSADNLRKISNYATLFVADQVSNNGNSNNDKVKTAWSSYNFNHSLSKSDEQIALEMMQVYGNTGLTTVGMMATYYANVEAMVQYINKQQEEGLKIGTAPYNSAALDSFNTAFASADFAEVADRVNNPQSGETKTDAAKNAVFEEMARTYRAMVIAASSDPNLATAIMGYNRQPDAAKDAGAFVSTMSAVNESAGTIGSDMTKDNLYGDGTVENLLTGYINAGDVLGSTADGVAVIATVRDGKCNTVAYPIDYVK